MDGIRISHSTFNGEKATAICIGEASGELPRHLLTGGKACGYTVREGVVESWFYHSISDRDGIRYIISPNLDLLAFTEISGILRPNALERLRELAQALQKVPAGFLNPTKGFLETWRIFFIREGGVLLLPEKLSQLMLYSMGEEDRFTHFNRYLKPDVEHPFGLCHQFTQFLYCAATGFSPYEDPSVREDGWRHIPLALGFTPLPSQIAQWIDHVLSMSPKEQRDIVSAAYSAEANLAWWLDQTADFSWSCVSTQEPIKKLETLSAPVSTFRSAQKKRAQRRIFWRKRGALVVTIVFVVVIVLGTVGNVVYQNLQPPYTAGMSASGVITEFFAAQNALDVQNMSESLKRGVGNPFELEVSGLFVNTRVRKAYEGFDPVIRADEWISAGRPAIPESSLIYGVVDLQVEQVGAETYRATYVTLVPSETGEIVDSSVATVDEMKRVTDFTLSDAKGYWLITAIEPVTVETIATYTVETFKPAAQ
jgi:hypothetical protein